MTSASKSKRYLIVGLLFVVVMLILIYMKLSQQGLICRGIGQQIWIGIGEEEAKCCKGLDAVIETKSNVRCLFHSDKLQQEDGGPRIRVSKFEQ